MIDCCAQLRTYEKFYGLLAQVFMTLHDTVAFSDSKKEWIWSCSWTMHFLHKNSHLLLAYIFTYSYMHIHMHTSMHTCMLKHTHTHTHTQSLVLLLTQYSKSTSFMSTAILPAGQEVHGTLPEYFSGAVWDNPPPGDQQAAQHCQVLRSLAAHWCHFLGGKCSASSQKVCLDKYPLLCPHTVSHQQNFSLLQAVFCLPCTHLTLCSLYFCLKGELCFCEIIHVWLLGFLRI